MQTHRKVVAGLVSLRVLAKSIIFLALVSTNAAPPTGAVAPPKGYQLQATQSITGYQYVRRLPVSTNAQNGTIIYQPVMESAQDRLWHPVARDCSDPRLRRMEAEAATAAAAKVAEETTVKMLPAIGLQGKVGDDQVPGLKIGRQGIVSGVLSPAKQRVSVNLIFYAEEEAAVKQLCESWLKQGKQPSQQMLDTALGNATVPPITADEAKQMQGNVRRYLLQTVIPALMANNPAARTEFKGLRKQFPDTQSFADEQLRIASSRMVEQVSRQAQAQAAGTAGSVILQPTRGATSSPRGVQTFTFITPGCKNCPLRKK